MLASPGVQELARLALEAADLPQYLVDLLALVLELRAAGGERGDELRELRPLVRRRIVELQHLTYLGEGEAEPLAAQDQLQSYPVALGIDAPRAVAPGAEQALVLVEADGAMSHVELARKLGDAVGFDGLIHRRKRAARRGRSRPACTGCACRSRLRSTTSISGSSKTNQTEMQAGPSSTAASATTSRARCGSASSPRASRGVRSGALSSLTIIPTTRVLHCG